MSGRWIGDRACPATQQSYTRELWKHAEYMAKAIRYVSPRWNAHMELNKPCRTKHCAENIEALDCIYLQNAIFTGLMEGSLVGTTVSKAKQDFLMPTWQMLRANAEQCVVELLAWKRARMPGIEVSLLKEYPCKASTSTGAIVCRTPDAKAGNLATMSTAATHLSDTSYKADSSKRALECDIASETAPKRSKPIQPKLTSTKATYDDEVKNSKLTNKNFKTEGSKSEAIVLDDEDDTYVKKEDTTSAPAALRETPTSMATHPPASIFATETETSKANSEASNKTTPMASKLPPSASKPTPSTTKSAPEAPEETSGASRAAAGASTAEPESYKASHKKKLSERDDTIKKLQESIRQLKEKNKKLGTQKAEATKKAEEATKALKERDEQIQNLQQFVKQQAQIIARM